MDGKSIMGILLLAAARGTNDHDYRRRSGRGRMRSTRAGASGRDRLRGGVVERLKGIGVSSGIAAGPALVAIQRTQVIRFPISPDRVARELVGARTGARRGRASSCSRSARGSPS